MELPSLLRHAPIVLSLFLLARPGFAAWQIVWPADVAVSIAAGQQGVAYFGYLPGVTLAADGSGGAWLAWMDAGSGNVAAQHLDATGRPLFGPGGVRVAPGAWFQLDPRVVGDGAGGAIVSWVDARNIELDIFAQRLDSLGRPLWTAGGVPVTTADQNQGLSGIAITSDGSNGAILAWGDAAPECCRIYAQRITGDGSTAWATNGVPVSPPITLNFGPVVPASIVSDQAGGAIVGFLDQQVEPAQYRLQRLSPTGQLLWPGGVALGPPGLFPFGLDADGEGGAIAAWTQYGDIAVNWYDIRAQRVNSLGQILWGSGGVAVTDVPLMQSNPQVVSDGAGAGIIVWEDGRNLTPGGAGDCLGPNGGGCDIYAQRLDPSGHPSWATNGLPVSVAIDHQDSPRAVSDGAGGAVIAWQDCRGQPVPESCLLGRDLYAQHVTATGTMLGAVNGVPVSMAPGNQGVRYGWDESSFVMAGNEARGAFLAWPDGRNGFCAYTSPPTECDVYAQRVIIDPEPLPRAFVADALATEDDGPATFHVALSYPPSGAVTIEYATLDGTAMAGADYLAQAGVLSFPPGIDSRPISVPLVPDAGDETDETLSASLTAPNGVLLGDATALGVILDDDPVPSVSVADCAVLEGSLGSSPCAFTVSLSAASSFPVTLAYATADGTATAGSDYAATSGALTFAPGQASQSVAVSVLGDSIVEADEVFVAGLSNPTNATLGDGQATGYIIDEDAPSLSQDELVHGSKRTADLAALPGPVADVDDYRIDQRTRHSYEVLVDGTSADVVPLIVERLAADNATVLQDGTAVSGGASVSLRFRNDLPVPIGNQTIRVRSGGCTTTCDANSAYRIRAYDTTSTAARFNNSGTQSSFVLIQNSGGDQVSGTVWFFNGGGGLVGSYGFSLGSHETRILNTATVVPGIGGTITVSSDGRYGVLAGKVVAIEPATGFTFDTILAPLPK